MNTLVARGDNHGVCLAVVPGDGELDLKALARATGDAKIVEHTGNDAYWGDGGEGGWARSSCRCGRSYAMTGRRATIRLKRAYEEPSEDDGTRILVERLWPRGVSKEAAAIDLWPKEVAPSTELRKWYGHDPDRWEEFRRRYWAELDAKGEVLDDLKRKVGAGPVTFDFAPKDETNNSAVALKE